MAFDFHEYSRAREQAESSGQTKEQAHQNAMAAQGQSTATSLQSSNATQPLSAYTDKKWIKTGGGRRHVDNFVVRNGKIFDVASENAAIRNTQANYEQFLNDKLKEYGSGRTGRYGQYTNNFMDPNRYAEHEMFMSTVNANNLEKQLKELQKEYERVRISGTGGSAETDLKKQIAKVESQIKEYQLDAKAAGEYMNLAKESQAAEEAWNKAQKAGLNSMDWYDQTKAEYDDIQQQLDDLYDQRRNAVRAAEAEDYSGWATDDLSAASIGGKNKADVSNIEGQIIRLTYQQNELKKQLGYADRYRWESVDTTDEQAIALGKATYDQQHQQWTDQMDTVSKLPTAGDYAAVSKRMLELSTSKDYKEPTEDWTEQQKNTYYVLLGDGSDTRRADEYAMNTNNLIQQQKNQAQAEAVGDAATSSFYSGAWRTVAATGAGLASGLEYLGDVQELVARGVITEKPFGLADYNQAVTGSISTYLNNQYGTLGDNAGPLSGKGLGDAYQIAQSVGQSWAAMALTGGSSAAVNVMFFGQAAKQTLDEQLAKGTDPYKAVLMGALAGSAEVIGETFSLENIKGLQAGQTKGLLLDILRSAGIEGSEEGVTTLLNTFADRIVNGNDSDYYVALEGYISQGMSYADAERAAMKDWVNGIAYDMIAGAVSGGISGGVGGPAVRAANEVVTGFQEFDGDTKTLLDTAASYKDTKAADLAAKYGGKESITVRQAGKLGKAIEKATEQQNERNIHNAISAELKARGVTSNTGDISDAIQKSASGKMLTKEEHYMVRDTPGARDIRDELFDRMTNGKLDAEKLAAEDTPQWLKNIEQKNGAAVAGEAMFGKFQREAAEQRLTEADRIETINPEVTIGDVSGKVSGVTSTGKTAQITIAGQDGKQSSVNLEDALESGSIPSDVAYLARSAAAFGPAANDVYNLYSPTQTAREYIAAMDAAINTVAANVGSRSAFEQSDSVKYLTKEQRDFAWSEGQKQRAQEQEKTAGKRDNGKKKTSPKEGRVSFGGVTYDGQTFKATTADKVKPEVRRVLEKFSAATGVDIVFYESEADQRGDYVGANGFYRNGTVYLDVHAGANSTSEKEAVLITAAHEFTHFIRENAPRRYNQLKEFVTEHLLENGYDFETLVERKIKAAQKDGGLSRDAAVEEVVADACEMVLGNSKAIERLAKEKPGLAKRIADWLHEFFTDIRKAFEGVEARHEEAKAMLDYMDELAKLWDDALVEAAESGGEVSPTESGVIYDNAGNPVAESTGDGTVMLSIRTYEEEGRDVLRKYLDTAVAQKKLTKAEAKDMAEEIERIYDICREFDGKYAQFGAWSRAEVVRDTHGRPVFSVVSPNGEYKMNLDFSLVCKKRRTLDAVFNEMARRGIIDDFELGQKSVVKINEIIRKHGFETACALCFVDAKRFRQASMADQFVRLYNELVTSLVSDDQNSNIAYFNFSQNTNRVAIKNGVDTWSSAKLDFSHLNHVMNTYGKGTVEYKAAKYIKDHAEGRKLLQRGDFMSSSGFDAVKIQNKTILKLYNSKKGTGGPKAAFGDVQYLNEIVRKAKSWTPEKAFAVGGVRVQSFSDYIPRMVFDYVQMIYDLAAVGLPAHAYTKETLFAKQFGLTGIKINMSLIPAIAKDGIAPGLDANGDYVWAGESFNYDEAVAIQNADGYTENCGTICVGVSEAHIRKLLRDPNIRMVIPYHKSGLNPIVAHMNKIAAFTDYTTLKTNPGGCQNTIDKDGNKVEKDFNFNAAVQKHGDPRAAADEYLKWCAANQYTAKFAEFANEDNYYKLLEDFTLYDNAGSFVPQRAVKAVFPTAESAFGSMKELIQSGLEEDAVIQGKRDAAISDILDEIIETLPRTEDEIEEIEIEQAEGDVEAGLSNDSRLEGKLGESALFSRRDSAEGLTKEEAREQAAAYTRLKAENAELRRRVEYWKGQTQRTKQATVRQADVNRFARQLIKRYGSTADQAYIRQALQEMGDYLVQNDGEALDYNQLRQMAVTVAAELVATAEATEESIYADDVAGEILSTIRNTDIRLDRQYFNDLPEGFRRDFRGKLHIFTDKGRSVDSIYAELQEEYGYDLFPAIDNPADQLVMMGDIFDRLSAGPEIYNPFRGAENEATLSIANEIMDTMLGEDIRQTAPTMKDKADAKVAEVKAEGKQALNQLRSDKNARIQEIRRQESLRRQEVRAKEKAAKWEKVAEVKAYYQNMQKNAAEKRRENAASKKYRDRVFDKVNTLETWLRKNTDKEHIPEALKEPLIAFLSSIDLTSKQQLNGKGPTQRDIKYTDALQKIKDIVENQAKYLNDPDNANGLDVYLDIPNGFDQSIKDHIESVNAILSGTDLDMSGPVVMMSSDQLKDLDFILTVLTNSIKKINQYITESHFASVMEGARESNAYMKELGKSRDKTVIGDNAEKFTLWSNTLPYYAFKRFGAAGVERFQALMNGWGKMAMNVQTVMQFTDKTYSADEAKRWEENVRTIDLSDGSQVRMTDAQIMGLWCLARREQGLGHILVGGIRVGDIEPKGVNKKRIQQNDASHLTQDDLNSIFGMLSDRQIEVAKKLQEFLNTTCSEWGNEVSMARFGYRQFTEQFYYPINVDRNNLPMSDPQARETDIFRLLNMSATKALTPNANNSVVINSIFDVFAAHTADMAKYNGLALPILDLLKWYNYKDKSYRDVVDSLGNITTQMTAESVQSIMERTYGKMAQKYVMNFMKDLNGVREGGRNEELLKGMVGKYKAAAVGNNLRVVIQQPTSIARAAYVIDPRYLARGMAMKGGIDEAMQNSGLAVWKSLGYFDTNIARNMRDQIKHTETAFDKITDKSMTLAELGDKVTWGAIWNAAKLEMKETRHLSGDELLKATQERFDEIILATQVMDSTISRSDMMRNQSLAVSEVTSFRSEPTVTYNMLLDSYMDFNMELRKTKSASTAFRRTGMKMVRAATVYAVTTALTAAAAAIVDAFRDDDDYQTAVEKWIEHFWDNFSEVKEPWRLLPIVDQLYDIFLNNETPDSMLWQSFVQLKKSGASAIELLKTVFGDNPEATSRYTAWGKAYTVLQGLSSISGLPVSAAYRDLKAIWNASGALLWPDKKIKFYDSGVKNQVKYGIQDGYLTEEEAISILVESGEVSDPDDAYWLTQEWLHADDSEWTRYNDLYAAILSGDEKAFSAAQEALGDHGIAASSVRTEAKNEIGRLYRGDDGTGRKLNEKQAVSYLMEFAGLGELEAKHLKDEWDLQRLYGLKVSEIGDAYVSGQITREEANDYYIRFGHDYPQDVKKKLLELDFEKYTGIPFSRMNDAYIHEEITEQQAQGYLMEYGGLTQAEAESKTLQWDLARDYGIQYGSEDEGIKKALIEDFIDQDTAITIMEVYGGKTHEEAVDYSYQYLFTKDTGYSFSEIQQALEDGVINEEQMADWYRLGSIYTHGSEEKAWEYVGVAKWKSEVPGGESMNRTGLEKWNKNSGKLKAQGLSEEDFAKVWTIYSKADAEYDSNGNQTKEKAEVVMEKIGQLTGYTRTQLTSLGYSVYSAKKVNAYKTW